MIKLKRNKAQSAINFTITASSFILILGISGSLETDRLSIPQFITYILTSTCIIFTLYALLSYVNYKLTGYIIKTYKHKYNLINNSNNHQKSLTKIS